jgi:hypothetical protein
MAILGDYAIGRAKFYDFSGPLKSRVAFGPEFRFLVNIESRRGESLNILTPEVTGAGAPSSD